MTTPNSRYSHSILKTLVAGAFAVTLSGCVIHIGGDHDVDWDDVPDASVTSVFGDLSVSRGKAVGDVSSVNGDIELYAGSSAERIDSVNGDISIEDNVSVQSIDVVNGDIRTGTQFSVERNIETVNGDIDFGGGSTVGGSVITVNGDIELNETIISNNLRTTNGDMDITDNSVIEGDIVFERVRKNKWGSNSRPTLRIDSSSTVNGAIILNRPVELLIDNPDVLAKVEERFSNE
jgi:hypothetical protein